MLTTFIALTKTEEVLGLSDSTIEYLLDEKGLRMYDVESALYFKTDDIIALMELCVFKEDTEDNESRDDLLSPIHLSSSTTPLKPVKKRSSKGIKV